MALRGCFMESRLVIKLMTSNPFSAELFCPDALAEVVSKAEHQAKSLLHVLEYEAPSNKRQSSAPPRNAKKAKMDQGRQGPQDRQRNKFQKKNFVNKSKTPKQNSPSKKSGGSPKSRFRRSPKSKTPKNQNNQGSSQSAQGKSSNF